MRLRNTALLASLALAWPSLALAQSVERSGDVTVNPQMGGAGATLLYPGGQYMRVVHPALQAGEKPADTGAIHLHLPVKHPLVARKAPAAETAAVAPAPAPKPASKPAARVAAARPTPDLVPTQPDPGGFTDQGAAGLNLGSGPGAAPQPSRPQRMAKAEPPPGSVDAAAGGVAPTPGLTKRSVILFAPQAADPAQSALSAIKFLAGDLAAAMTGASARVEIKPLAAIAATRDRTRADSLSSGRWRSVRS